MDPRFQDSQAKNRVVQPACFFTMNCLLCSRIDVGLLTDRDYYVEDVDAYMRHLHMCLADPSRLAKSRNHLSKYDAEIIKRLGKSSEGRIRYTIYRTDSDFLLLSVGTFAASPMRRGRGRQEPIEEGYIGRGKTYYHFAYSYGQRLHVRNTALGDVLEKLVIGFERYATILAQMRGEQTDLLGRLRRGERYIYERVVSEERRQESFQKMQDLFLDAILEYQRTRSRDCKQRVESIVQELATLRPGFVYDLGRLDAIPPGGGTGLGQLGSLPAADGDEHAEKGDGGTGRADSAAPGGGNDADTFGRPRFDAA